MAAAVVVGRFIVLFMILGMMFYSGKGSFLIAGYNAMPPEEKSQYDEEALCKFMGQMIFALSFSMVFWLLSIVFEAAWLFIIWITMFLAIVIFMLNFMNAGNRFKKSG